MGTITNILFTGVGGQGIITSSDIIADIALSRGNDVKKSEIHGIAQRGGMVYSYVRFGDRVPSPIPLRENIDYIVAFEELELLRWVHYANASTKIIVNTQRIPPVSFDGTSVEYSDVKQVVPNHAIVFIDATTIAKETGTVRLVSSVMTGALCACLGFDVNDFRKAFENCVGKMVEENIRAFIGGVNNYGPRP